MQSAEEKRRKNSEYCRRYNKKRVRLDPEFAQKKRDQARQWRQDNPDRFDQTQHRRRLERKYGLTPDQYAAINDQQRGACAICGALAYSERSGHRRLSVDHCHATGFVRELLCHRCNLALGLAEDNPDILRRAADYLDRHRAIASLLS